MALAVSAGTMSDGSPVTPQLDARMLADLREWRARRDIDPIRVTLTIDEVDMLLRVADDRDALRREVCGDPTPPFPPVRVAVETLTDAERVTINTCPHAGTHHNCPLGGCPTFEPREVSPGREARETPPGPVMHIAGRSGVLCGAEHVSHVTDGRRFADCPRCIEVYETRRCDSICDGDGGRSSCFTPWCRCTVCHGSTA